MNLPKISENIKFFDIAANLCDDEFEGIYHEKKYHESDINEVLARAQKMNVHRMLFAAGSQEDIVKSYELSKLNEHYYISAGIHPCRASDELKKNTVAEIFTNLETSSQNSKTKS